MNAQHNDEYAGDEQEVEIEALAIDVSSQPIELYKVMKLANLVSGGGEAKHAIGEGYVAVNGELETRKRRKMYDGDFFEFDQQYYVVVCPVPVTQAAPKSEKSKPASGKPAKKAASGSKNVSSKKSKRKTARDSKSGRSSIDFL